MSTTQPEFTMSQYASKDDMIGAMRQHIAELESRVQELGQMARDANSRRVIELEAELAAMRAGVEPVGYIITNTLVAGDRAIVFPDKADRAPKIFPRTPVYTHPQPAAQDAEPDMFWDADNREIFAYDIEEIVSEYDPGSVVTIECARRLPNFRVLVTTGEDENSYEYVDAAIAAQQGDSHE